MYNVFIMQKITNNVNTNFGNEHITDASISYCRKLYTLLHMRRTTKKATNTHLSVHIPICKYYVHIHFVAKINADCRGMCPSDPQSSKK